MPETTIVQDVVTDIGIFLPLLERVLGLFSAMFSHSGANAEAHAMLAETKAAHAELVAHFTQSNAVKHSPETPQSDQA